MRRILSLLALSSFAAAPCLAAPAGNTVSGRIVGADGIPLASVFVQQQGAIASAISNERGTFQIKVDPKGPQVLVFSAVGYLHQEVPLNGAPMITMRPLPAYRPTFRSVPPEPDRAPNRMFDTQVGMTYQARHHMTTMSGRTVEGLANNEVYGVARYRMADAVLGANGFRNKVPLTIDGLAAQPTMAPTVETSQWSLSLGYSLPFAGIEFLPQVLYSNYYVVPNNGGTPWTGTPLDYGQTRQGLGLGIEAGSRFEAWELFGRAAMMPAYSTVLSAAPYSVGDLQWAEIGLTLGYNLFPGLRADLSAGRQFAAGSNLGEWANVFGIGLTYHPERVTP